jgi:molybdate transport system ATP-binding protein
VNAAGSTQPAIPALHANFRMQRGSLPIEVNVEMESNELVVLVGPNGSGKTSLLHAIAGLVPIDAGSIRLEGRVLDDPAADVFVPPEQRPIALMFQDGLLFRHLDALDNVAFGPRARGMRKSAANSRARELLERFGLGPEARSKPHELSGGQAQRVALARALAVEPRALLLDEPLAALDAQTRVDVRRVLREQLTAFDGVRLLVTHDPLEALTLADRIVVIEDGKVVQTGAPDDVRRHPRSAYVAALLGVNLLAGRLTGDGRLVLDHGGELQVASTDSGPAIAIVDPNAVSLFAAEPHGSVRNCWRAVVHDIDRAPGRVRISFEEPFVLVADITPAAAAELALAPGADVWCAVKATAIQVEAR